MEEFERCRDLGFEYFQGFFLSRPQMIAGQARRASDLAVVQLLARLGDPKATAENLESIIKNDAALSLSLLRYVNSAAFAFQARVESLRQVIMLIGTRGVRTIAMLASMSGTIRKPGDVLKDAMQRAVMCERLAVGVPGLDPAACFTAGLLSSLDAIFDRPLEEITAPLQLSEELKAAVLRREGPIGDVLRCAVANECADWEAARCGHLTTADIQAAYLSSIDEVTQLWGGLAA